MRKYLSYSILFLTIFSLLPIWSIGQADMGQKPNAFAVLESEFEVSKLSAVQLEAFEARAIQKLRDLSDYYQVVSEDSYPLEMREQAVRLIKDLFSDSLKTIRFSKESATDPIPVYLYFHFSAPPESSSDLPPMDEISIHTPLKLKRKGVYVGELEFQAANSESNQKIPSTAEIILTRTSKQFGTEKSVVWEVKLGNIIF